MIRIRVMQACGRPSYRRAPSDRRFEQPENRRIGGVVEAGHFLVGAVDGQGVLDQVVGTDAQKVNFFDEAIDCAIVHRGALS